MAKEDYSAFHAFIQRIASSRVGAWYFSRTQHHLDRVFFNLTGGRTTITSIFSGLPVVILTTRGAKTGLPRTLPLLWIRDEHDPRKFALVASNYGQHHHPAWYFNLKANPRATCSIRGQVGQYAAHEAEGEEYGRFWQRAMDTYMGFPSYKQRAGTRRIRIMVMTPIEQ